jgi:hypothetical protein
MSDQINHVEPLYIALSNFMGIEPDKSSGHYITTAIGALEYSCAVARQCGVTQETLQASLTEIWDRFEPKDEEKTEQVIQGSIRE